jgi:hypothetical protein
MRNIKFVEKYFYTTSYLISPLIMHFVLIQFHTCFVKRMFEAECKAAAKQNNPHHWSSSSVAGSEESGGYRRSNDQSVKSKQRSLAVNYCIWDCKVGVSYGLLDFSDKLYEQSWPNVQSSYLRNYYRSELYFGILMANHRLRH